MTKNSRTSFLWDVCRYINSNSAVQCFIILLVQYSTEDVDHVKQYTTRPILLCILKMCVNLVICSAHATSLGGGGGGGGLVLLSDLHWGELLFTHHLEGRGGGVTLSGGSCWVTFTEGGCLLLRDLLGGGGVIVYIE